MFNFKPNIFKQEIGIDLGTSNTVIFAKSKGIVVDEPSVVAVKKVNRKGEKEIIAFGHNAKKMIGRTPVGITTYRPLSYGVIADFDMTKAMMEHYMNEAAKSGVFSHPSVAVCVPANVTEVEKRAVVEVTLAAGAREAFVVEEPIAAARGIDLPIDDAQGCMIVSMGGGNCEVAVLSLGGIVTNQSVRVAGESIDDAIVTMMRQKYMLAIGDITAEEVKMAVGAVVPLEQELKIDVKGLGLTSGLPEVVQVTSTEVRETMEPIIAQIGDAIRATLEITPPELVRDIVDQGIVLSGGLSQLRGINIRFADALNVPVHIAEEPRYAVAKGLGKILELPRSKNISNVPVGSNVNSGKE